MSTHIWECCTIDSELLVTTPPTSCIYLARLLSVCGIFLFLKINFNILNRQSHDLKNHLLYIHLLFLNCLKVSYRHKTPFSLNISVCISKNKDIRIFTLIKLLLIIDLINFKIKLNNFHLSTMNNNKIGVFFFPFSFLYYLILVRNTTYTLYYNWFVSFKYHPLSSNYIRLQFTACLFLFPSHILLMVMSVSFWCTWLLYILATYFLLLVLFLQLIWVKPSADFHQ